jgi:anti-sigma regulatory factor (Ser/Thr protein kinase)
MIVALNAGLAMNEPLEEEQMSFEIPEEELPHEEPRTEEDLKGLMERVADSLDDFAGGKTLSDDITMMCIEYLGGTAGSGVSAEPNMFAGISAAETGSRIKLAANTENFRTVFHFIERHLMQVDCPFGIQKQILIAAQEVYANIAGYAYAPDTGNVDIDIRITEDGSLARIMFIDTGVEFDPLVNDDPDPSGGMGLFIVKKLMDSVSYTREDGKNIFTMEKRIRESENV